MEDDNSAQVGFFGFFLCVCVLNLLVIWIWERNLTLTILFCQIFSVILLSVYVWGSPLYLENEKKKVWEGTAWVYKKKESSFFFSKSMRKRQSIVIVDKITLLVLTAWTIQFFVWDCNFVICIFPSLFILIYTLPTLKKKVESNDEDSRQKHTYLCTITTATSSFIMCMFGNPKLTCLSIVMGEKVVCSHCFLCTLIMYRDVVCTHCRSCVDFIIMRAWCI